MGKVRKVSPPSPYGLINAVAILHTSTNMPNWSPAWAVLASSSGQIPLPSAAPAPLPVNSMIRKPSAPPLNAISRANS